MAAPFWVVSLTAFVFDKRMRRLVRPMLPVFLIFALLLANLAQLQPGTAAQPLLTRVSASLGLFQRTYMPQIYVSEWPAGEVWQTLALFVFGLWAAARCWTLLTGCFRWLMIGTGICGVLSIPVSYLLLDQGRFAWAARTQPTRVLLYVVAGSGVLFGLAGMRAMLQRAVGESLGWFFLLFTLPASQGIFSLRLAQGALALALAALLTGLLLFLAAKPARFATLAAPVVAALALAHTPGLRAAPIPLRSTMPEMARWADSSTWGSSIFLFADAGRAGYPGVFRAQSRHGLWVDWDSARGVAFSETAAARWQERWSSTMQNGFTAAHLEGMLALPIDYYVLRAEHKLDGPRRSFFRRRTLWCTMPKTCATPPSRCGWNAEPISSRVEINAELFKLFGVIALVQKIVFLPALGNFALLRADLGASGFVDTLLQLQQVCHLFDKGEAQVVGIFANSKLARFSKSRH